MSKKTRTKQQDGLKTWKKNVDTKTKKNAIIKIEVNMFGGTRQEEVDKKLRSMLFLALGNEGKEFFLKVHQKALFP